MSKTSAEIITIKKPENDKVSTPWSCQHQKDGSAIDAYVDGRGEWATIAKTTLVENVDPKAIAEQIVCAVNAYEKAEDLMEEMAEALKLCLACDLSWEAEHDAEIVIDRYQELMKAKKVA